MWCLSLLLLQMDRQKYEMDTRRKSLQTVLALSATSKQCFEQPAASFLVCSLIFIEYQNEKADLIQESAIIQRLIFKFFMIFFIEIN